METKEHIEQLYKQTTGGNKPFKKDVEALLELLDDDEEVVWAIGCSQKDVKWGAVALITVSSKRLVEQRSKPGAIARGKSNMQWWSLEDIAEASHVRDKQLFGLLTSHQLVLTLDDGQSIRFKDLYFDDQDVDQAVEAIEEANKLGKGSRTAS